MADTNENGEASKLSLSPEKDAAQSVLISATTVTTSIENSEQTVVASESTHTMGEEEEEEEEQEEYEDEEDEDEEDAYEKDEEEDQAEKDGDQEKEEVNDEVREEVNGEGREVVNVNNGDEGNKQEKAVVEKENKQEKAVVEKENGEKDDAIRVEDEEKTEEPKTEAELGESSKGKGRKPRKKIRKKKVAQKTTETVTVDGGDKPESSSKEQAPKKVASMGMVFMCSSKTKADCFRYKILGLPESKKDQVAKIYKGMRLFLFDVDLRLMYGIFKAAGPGGYNIEPKAFKSAFPSQVRFTVIDDCLPLAEEKFKEVIKENYYSRNKFESKLNAEQVKKLCKLFVVPGKGGGVNPKNAKKRRRIGVDEIRRGRPDEPRRGRADEPRRGARASGDRDKRKRRARDEDRHPRPREQRRRYNDFEQPPVIYEREPYPSLVGSAPRYAPIPLRQQAVVPPGRSYGYERALDPILEPRTYRVLDLEPRRHDDIVSLERERERGRARDRDRYPLYSREPPSYRDPVYSSTGQAAEYHHPPEPALPPEYRLVSREYHPPPAVQPAEYRLSGGREVPSYRDVGLTTEYRSYAAASPPESRRPRTHYRY